MTIILNPSLPVTFKDAVTFKTAQVSTDFKGKETGDVSVIPHVAYSRGTDIFRKPSNFLGTELTAARYKSISEPDDGDVYVSTIGVSGQYAQFLFQFDILNYFKKTGDIPETWDANDLKANIDKIDIECVVRGVDPSGNGVVAKYFKPILDAWSEGVSHSSANLAALTISKDTLNDNDTLIDSDGRVSVLVHNANPSNGVTTTAIYIDYIKVDMQTKGKTLTVHDSEVSKKLTSLLDSLGNGQGTDNSKLESIDNKLSGTLQTELAEQTTREIRMLKAGILEQSYTFEASNYKTLVIQNLSQYVPIEFVLDGVFDLPNSHTTPDVNISKKIQRLEAGQVMKVRFSPSKISYRSLAGTAKIKLVCGQDADVTSLTSMSPFSDMRTLRYQIIAVDNKSNTLYAHSAGLGLYKSVDGGYTWSRPSVMPTGDTLKNGFITKNGTLFLTTLSDKVYRSTDGGATVTKVLDAVSWRMFDSIEQNTETGTIIFGENPPDASGLRLMRSTDDGLTWTAVLDRKTHIRHWHSVQIDPYSGKWVATSGDLDNQVEWWTSSDDGLTWECIVGGDSGVAGDQIYRTLGLFFTEEEYVWASDNPLWSHNKNFVCRVKKDATGQMIKGMTLPAPAYAFSQVGETWLLGTMPEGNTSIDRLARLYISRNEGLTWDKVLDWRVEEGSVKGGFASLSNTDQDGNLYIRLSYVEGYSHAPWYYGTLKLTL